MLNSAPINIEAQKWAKPYRRFTECLEGPTLDGPLANTVLIMREKLGGHSVLKKSTWGLEHLRISDRGGSVFFRTPMGGIIGE